MTVLGKILVVVNLVLSMVVCAFFIFTYVARTNWKDGFDRLDKQYKIAQASNQAYEQELRDAIDSAQKAAAEHNAALRDLENQLAKEKAQLAQAVAALDAERKKASGIDAAVASSGMEVARRQEEVRALEQMVKDRNERVDQLIKEKDQLRERAVAAEIGYNSLKDRNANLMARLEEKEKELARTRSGATGATPATAQNPPPEDVSGLVKNTDASGLMTITIGSDAGLNPGHTLEVFRLSPTPRYLGRVRILEVRPNEAVVKPVSRPLGTIQAGDRVASKILGT